MAQDGGCKLADFLDWILVCGHPNTYSWSRNCFI